MSEKDETQKVEDQEKKDTVTDPGKTFTQDELDAMFAERSKQAKSATKKEFLEALGVEKLEDAQAILKAQRKAEEDKKTEIQKAKDDAESWKAKHEQSEAEKAKLAEALVTEKKRNAVMAACGDEFWDWEDVWTHIDKSKLTVNEENGKIEGVEKAIEDVRKDKPHFVKGEQRRPIGTPNKRILTPKLEPEKKQAKPKIRL